MLARRALKPGVGFLWHSRSLTFLLALFVFWRIAALLRAPSVGKAPALNVVVHDVAESSDLGSSCGNKLASRVPLLLVGGQGGSGTRGIGLLLESSPACHFVQSDRNTRDSVALRRSHLEATSSTVFLLARSHEVTFADLQPSVAQELRRNFCKFEALLAPELASFAVAGPQLRVLAIKEPKLMYLLPLFRERVENLRFLHVTRDVRTISKYHEEGEPSFINRLYGPAGMAKIRAQLAALLGSEDALSRLPERRLRRLVFIKTWADTQRSLLRWAKAHLGPESYYHLRVEDVYVAQDAASVTQMFHWMGDNVSKAAVVDSLRMQRKYRSKYLISAADRGDKVLKEWVETVAGDVLDELG